MKTLTLSLALAVGAITGCASTSSSNTLASTGGYSSNVGSSGAVASRAGARIAEPVDRGGSAATGRFELGIPTPQPARDTGGVFAYPTPQPPIPERGNGGAVGISPYSLY